MAPTPVGVFCICQGIDVRDTTEGFFSRWVVVPFTAFFPAGVADPTLIDSLTSQRVLQGLLRGAVGGLQSVMRRGQFSIPESVKRATQRFREEADPVRGFIKERLTIGGRHFMNRVDVYNAYVVWATVSGYSPMGAGRFYESFNSCIVGKPISPRKSDGVNGYWGVQIE